MTMKVIPHPFYGGKWTVQVNENELRGVYPTQKKAENQLLVLMASTYRK